MKKSRLINIKHPTEYVSCDQVYYKIEFEIINDISTNNKDMVENRIVCAIIFVYFGHYQL